MEALKRAGVTAFIWLLVAYLAMAILGRITDSGVSAFYSDEVDATCVVERRFDSAAMSCLPGKRIK